MCDRVDETIDSSIATAAGAVGCVEVAGACACFATHSLIAGSERSSISWSSFSGAGVCTAAGAAFCADAGGGANAIATNTRKFRKAAQRVIIERPNENAD